MEGYLCHEEDTLAVDFRNQEVSAAPAVPTLPQISNILSLREKIVELMPQYPCV